MAKILFINPNKWGRGITHIWIASHSGILKRSNHSVQLFDCSFFEDWSENENKFNTLNKQYKKSDYEKQISYSNKNIYVSLQNKIDSFKPDIIFWSAISAHIHGEGEYVNIENGYNLLKKINYNNAFLITAGLQATSMPLEIFNKMSKIDILIRGESEKVLLEMSNCIDSKKDIYLCDGIAFKKGNEIILNKKQKIYDDLDFLTPYDYQIFDQQSLLRPYNGEVLKAVDYEMSRGCIYSCSYCVETIIQKYYGFNEKSNRGSIKNFKGYLRHKSSKKAFEEIKFLNSNLGIKLFRCQDTNFLTIDRIFLKELSELIEKSNLDISLYIETRPEGINSNSIKLLKALKVDGVGMGVELASEEFREAELNRFASQKKTIEAFKLLKGP